MAKSDDIEALIERHGDYIEHLCMRAAWGDAVECADLVQRVYLAILDNRESLRPDSGERQAKAWVRWQCRGVISHWRRSRRRRGWVPLDENICQLAATDDTSSRELIDELASRLPERDRRLLNMVLQGYSHAEIAAAMGLTTNNVNVIYSRIITRMRQYYDQITKTTHTT